jgi:tetratricopeptide (TPR) repeat protein
MLNNFLHELRRRHVIRAAIAYVVAAWLAMQIADVLLGVFDAPDWTMQVVLAVLVLGLPGALVFSWFFEITADGIKRTEDILPDDASLRVFDRRMNFVVIGLLVAGLSLSLYGNFRAPPPPPDLVSILIADFENQTGNDLFSGVVEDFLLVGLEVAPFVDAFPRNRAAAIAVGLSSPDDQAKTLNLETASLIALRQGVNVVIAGNIIRLNDRLTITVTGISAGDQQELFSLTENVASDMDILNAIADISRRLRTELGNADQSDGAGERESFAVTNLEAAAEYLKAQDLQLNRKLEEAVIHYKQALLSDPDFARAYAGLALTEQYLGNSDAATKNWTEALSRLDRLTERGRLRTLGNYFMINQRDYAKALETYESLVEKYPADNVAQNNLAVTAFYTMDFERALAAGRHVADRFPDHSGYRANLALYAMYSGRFDEASEVAVALIDDDPLTAYAYLVVALSSAVAGDFEETERTYRRMAELDQFGRSVALEGYADLAMYRGDYDAAIAVLDDAIREELALGANHTVALKQSMRAEALLRIDEREMAEAGVTLALENAGGDPAILVPAALALIELGDTAQAEGIATKMSEGSSQMQQAYALAIRAQIASANEDLDAAIDFANNAVATLDLWLIRYLRARILLKNGQRAEALLDLAICQERVGEGIAVFLNDRPSFRAIRDVEELNASLRADP